MAQEDKVARPGGQTDEALLLKKRARRRLIGAAVLASAAVIILPMVMDHQPPPPLRDIQVRIPSPDEGAPQRMVAPTKPIGKPETRPAAPSGLASSPVEDRKPESQLEVQRKAVEQPSTELRPDAKTVTEAKPAETKAVSKAPDEMAALAPTASSPTEAWEVQLGAYAEPARVRNIQAKLKELGVPTFTEQVKTPNGPRTRVRAGPFPTQEAAERAKARVKIIGIDGPVAKKQ